MRFLGELTTVIVGTAVCTSLLAVPLMIGSYRLEQHIVKRSQAPDARRRCDDCHRKYTQTIKDAAKEAERIVEAIETIELDSEPIG